MPLSLVTFGSAPPKISDFRVRVQPQLIQRWLSATENFESSAPSACAVDAWWKSVIFWRPGCPERHHRGLDRTCTLSPAGCRLKIPRPSSPQLRDEAWKKKKRGELAGCQLHKYFRADNLGVHKSRDVPLLQQYSTRPATARVLPCFGLPSLARFCPRDHSCPLSCISSTIACLTLQTAIRSSFAAARTLFLDIASLCLAITLSPDPRHAGSLPPLSSDSMLSGITGSMLDERGPRDLSFAG